MKVKKRRLNYKNTIFVYIMILSFIPIIVLGIVSYLTYMNGVSEKISAQTELAVSQAKNRVDTALYNIRSYYIKEISEEELEWLIRTDIWYSDYSKLDKAAKIMAGPGYYLSYISGYSFLNFDTEWVLSNRGMFKCKDIKNPEQVEDMFHLYDGTLTRTYWMDHMQMQEAKLCREEIKTSGLNLVLKAPLIKKEPHCLLIVNISRSYLQQVLQEDLADGDITVLDGEGNLIFSSNPEVGDYCRQNFQKLDNRNRIHLTGNKEYSLSAVNSGVLDWIYLVSYDMASMNAGGEMILKMTFALLLVIVAVMAVVVVTVRRIYQPVLNLTNQVNGLELQADNETAVMVSGGNEFDYISNRIDRLVDRQNFFENLVASQLPQLQELFLIRLIRGDIRKEQLGSYLVKLKINAPEYYIVIIGILKSGENADVYDEAKQDALRINVIENIPEEIKRLLFLPPIRYEKVMVFTAAAERKEMLEDHATDMISLLNSFVSMQYLYHISAGVSLPHRELSEFRNAYHEGLEAMKNNEFLGMHEEHPENNIFLFYSDIKENQCHYAYDRLSERELKEAIDASDTEAAFGVIDRFINALVENNVMQSDCYLHLHRLMIAGMLVATDAGIQLNQIFDKDMENNIFLKMNRIYDMEKMRRFIKYKVIEPIIKTVKEYRASKSAVTMKNIERLVKETNGNITLAECAERLNYHPSYIWKVTKSKYNTTFTDYVGDYKLAKAKELLLNTDKTIADIASILNYTNPQNFIRFFSKLEGITPGRFRTINKG